MSFQETGILEGPLGVRAQCLSCSHKEEACGRIEELHPGFRWALCGWSEEGEMIVAPFVDYLLFIHVRERMDTIDEMPTYHDLPSPIIPRT